MNEINTPVELVGVAVTGVLGIGWYARKFITKFAEESLASDKARAESDVVKVLREELGRQAEVSKEQARHNKELTEEIRSLHKSINHLNSEIAELRVENISLKRRLDKILSHPNFESEMDVAFDSDEGGRNEL
jgi:septal ring factor EnvC (AmiA/AmiB activator)